MTLFSNALSNFPEDHQEGKSEAPLWEHQRRHQHGRPASPASRSEEPYVYIYARGNNQ
jgi:hypothetical protein